ncbi:rhodanese-like domain-containing protein [Thermodesulfobacteriota bacterium]
MKYFYSIAALILAVFVVLPGGVVGKDSQPGSMVSQKCLKCHADFKKMTDIVAGDFQSRSNKAKSMQIKIGDTMQVVKYTSDTTVKNVPDIKALKKPIPVRVKVKKAGSDLVAVSIVAKPKMKVAEDQLMSTSGLVKLVAQGPEKGKYTLVDSRPGIRYMEGHIPTSISIPFPKMGELKGKLPKDKDGLLIFYCGGVR